MFNAIKKIRLFISFSSAWKHFFQMWSKNGNDESFNMPVFSAGIDWTRNYAPSAEFKNSGISWKLAFTIALLGFTLSFGLKHLDDITAANPKEELAIAKTEIKEDLKKAKDTAEKTVKKTKEKIDSSVKAKKRKKASK